MARVIPLLFLGESRRLAIAQRLMQALTQWRCEWLPEHAWPIGVEVQETRSQPVDIRVHETACFRVLADGQELAILLVPQRAIGGLLGMPASGADLAAGCFADARSLASALEREALRRLARAMLVGAGFATTMSLRLERETLAATEVLRRHATPRHVTASITLGDTRCALSALLAPELVGKLAPLRAAPVEYAERVERRRAAVTTEVVAVEAVLGNAEVSVSDLAALAVGDVIVLEQSLGDTAYLAMPGGERVSAAALGRVEGKRAIQIRGKTG
jgi:hypothetical protein